MEIKMLLDTKNTNISGLKNYPTSRSVSKRSLKIYAPRLKDLPTEFGNWLHFPLATDGGDTCYPDSGYLYIHHFKSIESINS
jgi:hypothetical protein